MGFTMKTYLIQRREDWLSSGPEETHAWYHYLRDKNSTLYKGLGEKGRLLISPLN